MKTEVHSYRSILKSDSYKVTESKFKIRIVVCARFTLEAVSEQDISKRDGAYHHTRAVRAGCAVPPRLPPARQIWGSTLN